MAAIGRLDQTRRAVDEPDRIRAFFARYVPPEGTTGLTPRMVAERLGLPRGVAKPHLDRLVKSGELEEVRTSVRGPVRYRASSGLRAA